MRTQEDEARGTDELDEGYLTRGGADEANWPAPQPARYLVITPVGQLALAPTRRSNPS